MANMPKTTKRQVATRLDLDLCYMVEKKFGQPYDTSKSTAYIRALEDATRDVQLTAKDYKLIAEEVRRNELKRKGQK